MSPHRQGPRNDESADAPASGPIAVLIVEDQREIREGLARLIDRAPGVRCIARYRSMEEALAARLSEPPTVALLDIGLRGMSGIVGIEPLKARYPDVLVLMITVHNDDERIFEAMCAGACGYLLKKTPPAKLLEAIREAHEGGAPMSPEIARKVITLFQQSGPPEKLDEPLTPQETRLLKLLSEGYSYQNSAGQMNISINTIRNYIRSIYEKLHVNTKSEAVSKALRHRLIQ